MHFKKKMQGRDSISSSGWSRKLLNSQTPKFFGERLDAINIFRARKLPSLLFFFGMNSDGVDHS